MQKYTIHRKLFAFDPNSWIGIRDEYEKNKNIPGNDSSARYEGYKRKYGKQIEEFEKSQVKPMNNLPSTTVVTKPTPNSNPVPPSKMNFFTKNKKALIGTGLAATAAGIGMGMYLSNKKKNRKEERQFNESDDKKKDSGFGWGKALGTTAAIAGTMYGAKKGIFGNTIRRGYNTAYGHVGNIFGNKSMIQSAASDYARGTNPQSKADFRKAYGEFNNKFDLTKGYKTTAAKTAQEAGVKSLDQIKNSTPIQNNSSVFTNTKVDQPLLPATINTNNSTAVTVSKPKGDFSAKKQEIKERLGTYKNQGPVTIKEMNQEAAQREAMMERSRNQQKKKRTKITASQKQERVNNVRQTLGDAQYNSKNPNSKEYVSSKNSSIPVSATASDYYNNPYNEYRMAAYSTYELRNQRFFSEKEDSSHKKKIRNAALLGTLALGTAAVAYGMKKDKNRKKKIKELEETIKNNHELKLKEKRKKVADYLENSKKEMKNLRDKCESILNGEYKYTDKDLESFSKFMEDKNSVLDL